MKNAYNHRLRLVEAVRERGIKPTARLFATSALTVRKWWRRYQQHGPSGLKEHSRAPHHHPQKTPPAIEEQVLALRQKLPTFGAARLKREFDLPLSHMAMQRIWREHGLRKPRKKKYQRKQDLAHIKAQWALFQQISADTKDLDDIPQYWLQAQRLALPPIQYTAREVRSGMLFWAFAEKRSAAASAVFAARIQQLVDRCGISLRDLLWQTDNGGEFKGDFPKALGDRQHVRASRQPRIPIRAMWRPFIAWKKTSSLTSKSSEAEAISLLRSTPISCTLISCALTPTKKIKAPGKSSSASLRARRLNSACFHLSSWITTSTTQGVTMSLGFPSPRPLRGEYRSQSDGGHFPWRAAHR